MISPLVLFMACIVAHLLVLAVALQSKMPIPVQIAIHVVIVFVQLYLGRSL